MSKTSNNTIEKALASVTAALAAFGDRLNALEARQNKESEKNVIAEDELDNNEVESTSDVEAQDDDFDWLLNSPSKQAARRLSSASAALDRIAVVNTPPFKLSLEKATIPAIAHIQEALAQYNQRNCTKVSLASCLGDHLQDRLLTEVPSCSTLKIFK